MPVWTDPARWKSAIKRQPYSAIMMCSKSHINARNANFNDAAFVGDPSRSAPAENKVAAGSTQFSYLWGTFNFNALAVRSPIIHK